MIHGVLPLREPCAGKLARTVLGGRGSGNTSLLPYTEKAPPLNSVLGGYISSDIQSHSKTSEEVAVQLQGVIIGRYI